MPTRFRYRQVEANDFGLTDEEILFATDKELNKWCSIKKMSQYRSTTEESYDLKAYQKKAQNLALKRKIFQTIYGSQKGLCVGANKKRRKKRRSKKPIFTVTENTSTKLKHQDHKKSPRTGDEEGTSKSVTFERLKAYGLSNRQIKKRQKIKT